MKQTEKAKIFQNMCYGRVVILKCELTYPKLSEVEKFFAEICEKCLEWAKERLYPEVCKEYENDSDTKKRFTFGFEYIVKITADEALGECVRCVCSSCVKKRSSRETFFESSTDFVLRLRDGAIMPPKEVKRLKKRHDEQKSKVSTVLNDEK